MAKTPIRTCIGCREMSDKKTLLRIVRTSHGEVRVDKTGKAAGRGAYLCGDQNCVKAAIKHRKLSRALRCIIPQSVVDEIENMCGANCENC